MASRRPKRAAARPSRVALRTWLTADGRSQVALAQALSITQQTVSALLRKRRPGTDLAQRIQIATGIPWLGWYTARERRLIEQRLERARSLAVPHAASVADPDGDGKMAACSGGFRENPSPQDGAT